MSSCFFGHNFLPPALVACDLIYLLFGFFLKTPIANFFKWISVLLDILSRSNDVFDSWKIFDKQQLLNSRKVLTCRDKICWDKTCRYNRNYRHWERIKLRPHRLVLVILWVYSHRLSSTINLTMVSSFFLLQHFFNWFLYLSNWSGPAKLLH